MSRKKLINRRAALQAAGAGALGALAASSIRAEQPEREKEKAKGNIKQSVCRWCYDKVPLDKLAAEAAKMGYKSIELLFPEDYKVVKAHGLTCAMIRCRSIADGLNRKENHAQIERELRKHIEFAADEGLPNVI